MDREFLRVAAAIRQRTRGDKKMLVSTYKPVTPDAVREIIAAYKLYPEQVEFTMAPTTPLYSITLITGNNEGYFVKVEGNSYIITLRYHDKDAALKAMGSLLVLLPDQ